MRRAAGLVVVFLSINAVYPTSVALASCDASGPCRDSYAMSMWWYIGAVFVVSVVLSWLIVKLAKRFWP